MRKLILAASLMIGFGAIAQELPQPSPSATVEQRMGLTDVTIKYSRPSMKGREIFGKLVPYGEMWRSGANKNTTLEFSTAVNFGGQEVKAGTYSLFTIPQKDEKWTIILNTKTDMWGTGGYNKAEDALRIEVPAKNSSMKVESFTIGVDDIHSEGGTLTISWANTRVAIPMEVNVHEQALANIEEALDGASEDKRWMVLRNAAGYHLNSKSDLQQGLQYIEESIDQNEDSWYSHFLKAEILAEMDRHGEAVDAASHAIEVGQAAAKKDGKEFGYTEMIQKNISNWKQS